MQALDVIVGVVNKKFLQSLYTKRRGPKGYGHVRVIRLLVYAQSKQIHENKSLVKHLKKYPEIARKLGFKKIPSRSSIIRWKREYAQLLEKAVEILGKKYASLRELKFTAMDSAPLEDSTDPEAKSGKTSKGWFRGFKIHMNSDDLRVPLRAKVTTGNVHDSQPAKALLVPSPATLADAAYDDKKLKEAALEAGTVLIADENPRRGRVRKKKRPMILKKLRYIAEQVNSLLKDQTMKHAWWKVKGLANKTTFALSAVVFVQALAIFTLLKTGEVSLHVAEVML